MNVRMFRCSQNTGPHHPSLTLLAYQSVQDTDGKAWRVAV